MPTASACCLVSFFARNEARDTSEAACLVPQPHNARSMSQVVEFNAQSPSVEQPVIKYVTLKNRNLRFATNLHGDRRSGRKVRPFRSKRITSRKINSYYT